MLFHSLVTTRNKETGPQLSPQLRSGDQDQELTVTTQVTTRPRKLSGRCQQTHTILDLFKRQIYDFDTQVTSAYLGGPCQRSYTTHNPLIRSDKWLALNYKVTAYLSPSLQWPLPPACSWSSSVNSGAVTSPICHM